MPRDGTLSRKSKRKKKYCKLVPQNYQDSQKRKSVRHEVYPGN